MRQGFWDGLRGVGAVLLVLLLIALSWLLVLAFGVLVAKAIP